MRTVGLHKRASKIRQLGQARKAQKTKSSDVTLASNIYQLDDPQCSPADGNIITVGSKLMKSRESIQHGDSLSNMTCTQKGTTKGDWPTRNTWHR